VEVRALSNANQDWNWLISICSTFPGKDINGEPIDRNDWKFFPGLDGQPWVSYHIVSSVVRIGVDRIRKKATKLKKHPAFTGLIRMTDFEAVYDGEEESEAVA